MKTNEKRIVESVGSPNENDLWLNGKVLKKFQNGQWVEISGGEASPQLQADWNQVDNTKADYIKNKPTIPSSGLMMVYGTVDEGAFTPDSGQPSFSDAKSHIAQGGIVVLRVDDGYGEEGIWYAFPEHATYNTIYASNIAWLNE